MYKTAFHFIWLQYNFQCVVPLFSENSLLLGFMTSPSLPSSYFSAIPHQVLSQLLKASNALLTLRFLKTPPPLATFSPILRLHTLLGCHFQLGMTVDFPIALSTYSTIPSVRPQLLTANQIPPKCPKPKSSFPCPSLINVITTHAGTQAPWSHPKLLPPLLPGGTIHYPVLSTPPLLNISLLHPHGHDPRPRPHCLLLRSL